MAQVFVPKKEKTPPFTFLEGTVVWRHQT